MSQVRRGVKYSQFKNKNMWSGYNCQQDHYMYPLETKEQMF